MVTIGWGIIPEIFTCPIFEDDNLIAIRMAGRLSLRNGPKRGTDLVDSDLVELTDNDIKILKLWQVASFHRFRVMAMYMGKGFIKGDLRRVLD